MTKTGRKKRVAGHSSAFPAFLFRNNNSLLLPLLHTNSRSGGGALLSCFPAFLINQENRRGTEGGGFINEESKKAGNADDQNPLASSSGTTIRSFSHYPARSAGGALLSSFIRPVVCPSHPLHPEIRHAETRFPADYARHPQSRRHGPPMNQRNTNADGARRGQMGTRKPFASAVESPIGRRPSSEAPSRIVNHNSLSVSRRPSPPSPSAVLDPPIPLAPTGSTNRSNPGNKSDRITWIHLDLVGFTWIPKALPRFSMCPPSPANHSAHFDPTR